jgi:hypothetical protein
MLAKVAILAVILVALAWQERKNKLILFGVVAVLLLLGVIVTMGRFPVWASTYLTMASFFFAVICLAVVVTRVFSFLRGKKHL